MTKHRLAIASSAIFAVLATCASAPAETINAAGATFPAVIYQKWFQEFHKLHSDIQINYQSIGSGAGITQLTQGTVDFGASDMPMTEEQMGKITKYKVLHFPTVLGGVVPTYNLEGVGTLNFSGETLANIYLGKITKWNDAALKKDNPERETPGCRHHCGAPLGWQRNQFRLYRLPVESQPGVEKQGGLQYVGELAGWSGRQRQ